MSLASVATAMPSLRQGVLVALHSSAAGPRQWDRWAGALPAALEFVTPALAGYGGDRDWLSGGGITLHEEALRIGHLLSKSREGVHLVGHSYGGAVAMEVARLWPEHVRSLTLYEPVRVSALRVRDPLHWESTLRLARNVRLAALSGDQQLAGRYFIDYWSGDSAWEGMTAEARARIASFMPKVQAEFDAVFSDSAPLQAWGGLRMPVHLICGERSPMPVRRVAERLAQVIPNVRLRQLAGHGHMAPLHSPRAVMRAMGLLEESESIAAAA